MSEALAPIGSVELAKPVYDPNLFHRISQRAQANYAKHMAAGEPVFRVELKKGDLFDIYLAALPEEHRQQMNCSCCRSFLNRNGGLVRISTEADSYGKLTSLFWNDIEEVKDPVFNHAVALMRRAVESANIGYHFLSSATNLGEFEKGGFEHFAVVNAAVFTHELHTAGAVVSTEMQSFANLSKFIGKDAKQDVLDQALVFFKHDQRLKGQAKWVGHLEWLADFKRQRDALPQNQQRAYTWVQVATQTPGRVDIKNSPIGKFLKNVISGDSYEVATQKFLKMTDGVNYMRPTAAPKQGNIQRAEVIFEKLELAPSLERRPLMQTELRNQLWVQPVAEAKVEEKKPLFGHLAAKEDTAKPAAPKLPEINGGNITLKRFLEEVLPETQELFFNYGLRSTRHNFNSFTTAVHADAKPILNWDDPEARNPVSGYCYHGGSTAYDWNLPNGLVRIIAIIPTPEKWTHDEKPFVFGSGNLVFVLESGYDTRLRGSTPMFPETFRPELHEVRSVLESFFRSKALTPLEEGQKQVVGIGLTTDGQNNLNVKVVKKDAVVLYTITQSH